MRFAALGGSNVGDYAAAGKAVADSAAKTFAVQRKTGPDYGKLSQVAMVTASEEKMSAMKASAQVTKAGINAYETNVKQGNKIAVFNKDQEIKAKQKMAGGVAAVGKMVAVGYLSRDTDKGREYPSRGDAYTSLIDSNKKTKAEIEQRRTTATAGLTAKPTNSEGGTEPGKVSTGSTPTTGTGTGTGMSDGWSRWSKVIKAGEGTTGDKGYTTMFTGAQFTDLSKHPELLQSGGGHKSDAAGAYQFLSTTWKPAAAKLGVTDFTPASQEKVGKYLAQQRGLAADTVFTDKASFLKELDKIAPEWASMPTLATGTSYYGQGGLSPDEAWRLYNEQ
jgi:muramidase (phage lysozyme)